MDLDFTTVAAAVAATINEAYYEWTLKLFEIKTTPYDGHSSEEEL